MQRRIAIITGVSRLKGIGRAICVELAKRNIDIFFTYWTAYDNEMPWKVAANEPSIIQEEIQAMGVRCEKIELDLSEENAVHILLEEVHNKLGAPSILVNNATYSTSTSIEDFSAKELDKHYAVNIKATTLLTIEFIKQFNLSHGRIINLSSGQSLGPMPNEIAYAITKSAIETLTYTLHQEAAKKNITINSVNPGPTDTGWMNENLQKELVARFPMKRIRMPKDVARLISFLASEEAEWVTGQVIHSEGGFMR